MWRQIICQSVYQIIVNLVIMYFGGMMLGEPYNLVTFDPRNKDKLYTDTFLFHTFFMMTMFNQINSRIVDKDEINMFKAIHSNKIFLLVWVVEMAVQHFMLFWSSTTDTGRAILGMEPLSVPLQVISVCIGAFSLVVHVIHVKAVPDKKFGELDEKIAIEDETGAAVALIDNISNSVRGKLS